MEAPCWEFRAAFAAPVRGGRAPQTPECPSQGPGGRCSHPRPQHSQTPGTRWSLGLNWEGFEATTALKTAEKDRLSRIKTRRSKQCFLHLIPFSTPITQPCPWGKIKNTTTASGMSPVHRAGICPAVRWHRRAPPAPPRALPPVPGVGTGTRRCWGPSHSRLCWHVPAASRCSLPPLLLFFLSEQSPNAFVIPQHR